MRKRRKVLTLLALVAFLTFSASAQTLNQTRQALDEAKEDIRVMEQNNIPTQRAKDLLERSNRTFQAQRALAEEGGDPNYARVIELTRQLEQLKDRAINVKDRINALEIRLQELSDTGLNLSEARAELQAAKREFRNQRFEQAESHVENSYSEISDAQSAQTQLRSFAAAQRQNLISRYRATKAYVRENFRAVSASFAAITLLIFVFWRKFMTFRLRKRREKKEEKKKVLEDLIEDLQGEYYLEKDSSELEFKTKLDKFQDMRRETEEEISTLESRIEERENMILG